ncbi:uncharacterized protein LOC142845952 isoform X1 [Microtus pennsylvanicus]|uniref:uncharacterized protein LOC142845952 isoform X1 n=2 Tax=Microtus pennsylvanicus TaxID=10058 RepID=UPI003F6A74C5
MEKWGGGVPGASSPRSHLAGGQPSGRRRKPLTPPPPSDNSHGDKMAARRPTGEPPAQRRGRLPLHPENGRHPGAGSPAGLAVQMARTDSGPQVREGRGPPARRALSRPDPQARAAGLLQRLCAPGSPPVGTRVPAEPGPRPPWGRGGPPAPRETWLLVLVRRRRGHQSPRCDLGERLQKVGGSPSSPPLDHLFHPDASRGS